MGDAVAPAMEGYCQPMGTEGEHAGRNAGAPILVVDDDAGVRTLLALEIARLGHPVRVASDAVAALRLLGRERFAVVVTDIRMPGLDGLDLTRRIREQHPGTEVVFCTGYASVETAVEAVRLGAADYLQKPIDDLERIAESIDLALERRRQRLGGAAIALEAARGDSALACILDRLHLAVMLLDAGGRLFHANAAARSLLDERDGLMLGHGGRLYAGRSEETVLLRRLLERREGARGGVSSLPRPSGRAALSIAMVPVSAEPVTAALFVSDPERRACAGDELLCRQYGLTPAEARVACLLMQGQSVSEIASELEISLNTARTHLKRVYSKTSTRGQGDLVSLLLNSPAPILR
jgi:FixJ family two-component response regulator